VYGYQLQHVIDTAQGGLQLIRMYMYMAKYFVPTGELSAWLAFCSAGAAEDQKKRKENSKQTEKEKKEKKEKES
jgi:hypothetical protein